MTGRTQLVLKHTLDRAAAVGGLLALSPVLLAVAAAVRLDSRGPALFRQHRLGQGGRVFEIFKFRTMVVGAGDGAVRADLGDARLTRLGGLLRRLSIDELPQLLNVARGEMSLVGPRPDRTWRLEQYTAEQRRRLDMKPGLTGLAQVSGRNGLGWVARNDLDVRYVTHWSLRLDAKIVLRTLGAVLGGKGVDFVATDYPPKPE